LLARALDSVWVQTRPPDAVSIAIDHGGLGAAATRNEAWQGLRTDWVAFLDDDDELDDIHLEACVTWAEEHDADMVYPWFTVRGGVDPFPHHFGKPWDPREPHQTTVTCLWRRDALEKIDGFPDPDDSLDGEGNRVGEDYAAVLRLNDLGGRIVHLPERTWWWDHHLSNTSGLPWR
jgi:hypothetical protein